MEKQLVRQDAMSELPVEPKMKTTKRESRAQAELLKRGYSITAPSKKIKSKRAPSQYNMAVSQAFKDIKSTKGKATLKEAIELVKSRKGKAKK